jgi:RNA polymerase sigma-70 factor, ECF subfamily
MLNEPQSRNGDGVRQTEDKSSKDPFFLYLTKVRQADVRKAIEELPLTYREVIVLREFEELSYEEIAQVSGCPPSWHSSLVL